MADDPDAPWRPGSTIDMTESDRAWSFDLAPDQHDARPISGKGRWRSVASVAAVLASVGLVAAVVLGVDDAVDDETAGTTVPPSPIVLPAPDRSFAEEEEIARFADTGDDVVLAAGDAPISMGPGACLHQRLPMAVPLRWSVDFPGVSAITGSIEVGGDVAVVSVVPVDGSFVGGVETVALDTASGEELWRLDPSVVGLGGPQYVRVFDDAVVMLVRSGSDGSGRRLLGVAPRNGGIFWEIELDRLATVAPLEPSGSVVVWRPSGEGQSADATTSIIDVASGESVTFRGGPVALDESAGLAVTELGDVVFGQRVGTSGPERLTVGVGSADSVAVVGGALLVVDGEAESVVRRSLDPRASIVIDPLELTGSVRIDPPTQVEEIRALDDSSVVIVSDLAVHGANVGENVVEIRWRVAGRLVGDAASDRGRTLIVRRSGGRVQRLLDSSTGRAILDTSSLSNELSVSDLLANGVVVRDGIGAASTRSAFDLDGRALWSLPGFGPLAVGDRMVIDWSQQVEGSETSVRVDAFGEVPDTPATCATARASIQGGPG